MPQIEKDKLKIDKLGQWKNKIKALLRNIYSVVKKYCIKSDQD